MPPRPPQLPAAPADTSGVSVANAARSAVRRYDFRQSQGLDRSASRALRSLLDSFAQRCSASLSALLSCPLRVRFEGVDQQTWTEFSSPIARPTALATIGLSSLSGRAVLHLPLELALAWIELRLGGRLTQPSAARPLTELEQVLLRTVVETLAADLAGSMSVQREIHVTGLHLLDGPALQHALRADDLCCVATMVVQLGERMQAAFTLCLPLVLLRPVVEAVGEDPDELPAEDSEAPQLEALLPTLPVEVVVRFRPMRLPAAVLLGLAPGDVLRLWDREGEPLSFVAGGQPLFAVSAVSRGSRLACVVVEPPGGDPPPAQPLAGGTRP